MKYRPNSIKREGLKAHLDKKTKLGYVVFAKAVEQGVSLESLRKLFEVSRPTIQKWVDIYHDENKNLSNV